MSERQARVTPERAVANLIQAVDDDPRKLYYTTPEGAYVDRNVEAARQAVLAMMRPADAVGRERVSEAEAGRQLDAYGRACVALDRARHGSAMEEEMWVDERAEIRRYLIALLTAAPAERGDETGDGAE